MGNFISYENRVFQVINRIVDTVLLSILWTLTSLPMITLGASTTALYYSVNKVIRHDRGSIGQDYWNSLRNNFKQSTLLLVLMILIYVVLAVDCNIVFQLIQAGEAMKPLLIILLVAVALFSMWSRYWFPYIARFENKNKDVLKNTFRMAVMNIQWSFLAFVIFAVELILYFLIPGCMLFMPAVFMLLTNFVLEKVFVKYMSSEDLEAEERRNRCE